MEQFEIVCAQLATNRRWEKICLLHQSEKTYLLIGHVTRDVLPDGTFVAGGTVIYAGVAAKSLGWRPVIVTAAAADFEPPGYLDAVHWKICSSIETTTYRNEYGSSGRTQVVGPVARSIAEDDIPTDCRQAAVVHLGPVAQELEPSIAQLFRDSLLVATPQGWMRHWNAQGVVSRGGWRGVERIVSELECSCYSWHDAS